MGICIRLYVFLHFFLILSSIAIADENGRSITNTTTAPTQTPPAAPPPPPSRTSSFKPEIAIIVGILTTIFSITFLLLLYVKHCKRNSYENNSRGHGIPPSRSHSGIDRKVIDSLPLFRFSSLRGEKDGLECAVCLMRFEAEDVLRLLPKCKHAFHIECVDTWLDAHSTCPLCRYRVDPEDVLLVDYNEHCKSLYNNHSNPTTPRSSDKGNERANRVSGRHSSAGERGSSLEIIVEKPVQSSRSRRSFDGWSSRRRSGNWLGSKSLRNSVDAKTAGIQGRRSTEREGSRKDGKLPLLGDKHRLEHRIIISTEEEEGAAQRRWSDVQTSDFLYLKSEQIMGGVGGEREEERGSGRGVINERSVSEITRVSRYRNNNEGGTGKGRGRVEEEKVAKRWLDWISQSQQQKQKQKTAVRSASASASVSASSSIIV